MTKLTIAICTFNRSQFLEICLSKLLPQIQSNGQTRVLIIDNNSSDDTRKVFSVLHEQYSVLEYTLCIKQGLSHARNHALEQCKSSWLSFIDDDAYPEENWVQQNELLINSNKYEAFGGVYLPWYFAGKKPWFLEKYETNSTFMPSEMEKQLTPKEPYFSGGNCTFKVENLLAAGGFSPSLGMNGSTMGYGEEVSAQRLIAMQGGRLGFSRNLVIYHYVPMQKQTILWAWRKAYKIGRDFWFIWDKPVTSKSLRFYILNKVKKSSLQTKGSFDKVLDRNISFGWKNVLYGLAGWAGLIGLIVGSCKRYYTDSRSIKSSKI